MESYTSGLVSINQWSYYDIIDPISLKVYCNLYDFKGDLFTRILFFIDIIFSFVNSNENKFIYSWQEGGKTNGFLLEFLLASSSRLSLFVTKSKGQNSSEEKKFREWEQNDLANLYFELNI